MAANNVLKRPFYKFVKIDQTVPNLTKSWYWAVSVSFLEWSPMNGFYTSFPFPNLNIFLIHFYLQWSYCILSLLFDPCLYLYSKSYLINTYDVQHMPCHSHETEQNPFILLIVIDTFSRVARSKKLNAKLGQKQFQKIVKLSIIFEHCKFFQNVSKQALTGLNS